MFFSKPKAHATASFETNDRTESGITIIPEQTEKINTITDRLTLHLCGTEPLTLTPLLSQYWCVQVDRAGDVGGFWLQTERFPSSLQGASSVQREKLSVTLSGSEAVIGSATLTNQSSLLLS